MMRREDPAELVPVSALSQRPATGERLDWLGDADYALAQQEPLRARAALWVGLAVLLLLLVWAALAQIDEVTRGEARVVPSRQIQIVQSVDGGVVEQILVSEGDFVEAGQLLLRIDPTRFTSSLGENRAELFSLQAKAARLSALIQGVPLNLPPHVVEAAPDVADQERRLYASMRAGLAAQLSIAQEQLSQRRQELNEARARQAQAAQSLDLLTRELQVTRPLVQSGAVSEVEVLRLEREVALSRGQRDQATAQISRVQASIEEANRRIEEVQLSARNQMSSELSEAMGRLAALTEGSRALEDRVRHAEVRAPVRGTIVRLRVTTEGGVVQSGREVVDILPVDDALVLEVRISPRDIAFLRPGQEARVKFTAYDFSIYGALGATLELISADAITDEQGDTYYLARVRTHQSTLGEGLPVIPGMVAQVDILTGKRSVLTYLLKPILRAKQNALTER
ncbi:MAG: HlyD family type I secretion periplasmic adaptor subunit [Zoogloeaceae bacterium]|nr:HlyD family type I secretion periplasmic adaptor subunit [Zoogloeaceae bacterium]